MKYQKFKSLRDEFGESWGVQLANEMVCGKTGDARYCKHFIRQSQLTSGECKLGFDPQTMEDWKCSKHSIIPEDIKVNNKKKSLPNISKWFDIESDLIL
jgi:hypothetical protein